MKTKLKDGMVSKGHKCPYHTRCEVASIYQCNKPKKRDFSCAIARGFEIIDQRKPKGRKPKG